MKTLTSRLFWGIILVLGGILFLLENLNLITFSGILFGVLFGIVGAAFLVEYFTNRDHWWAIIPGLVLLALSAIIITGEFFPSLNDAMGGVLFLGAIGLAFLLVFLRNRSFWWAIIPAGVLLTLSTIVAFSNVLPGDAVAGVLFLGFAVTFGLLSIVPTPQGRMRWPLIPAAALLVLGIFITTVTTDLFRYVWPVLLILAGLYLFIRRPVK